MMLSTEQTATWGDVPAYRSSSPAISSSASTAEATAGNDGSSFLFDDYRKDTAVPASHCQHWVSVGHLSLSTTEVELKALFYPYGADEAFIAWEESTIVGYVGFDSPDMAELAVYKMHAFIPRRQSQALKVHLADLQQVSHARCMGSRSLLAVLYSDCAPQSVSATIRRSKSPAAVAGDVATEVARASSTVLRRIVAALSDLSPQWFGYAAFSEELLKALLRLLLEAGDLSIPQAINCGATVGELFQLSIITGDPYYLGTRLLQRGGHGLAQLEGVCALAHSCASLPDFHISRAAFWAQVAEMATKTTSPEVNQVLLGHLRCYTRSSTHAAAAAAASSASIPLSLPTPPRSVFSTMPCSPAATAAAARSLLPPPQSPPPQQQPRQDEMKRRTIYISHLPGLLPQSMLLELLVAAGQVNKVRVCAGAGYSTLFAFVEMRTVEGAQRAMCMNGLQLMGYSIRVQTARNAVQDVIREDAQFDMSGALAQPCLFGRSHAPLGKCLTPVV